MRIEPDDVLLSKGAIIERCIRRIHEEYHADPSFSSFTHMDAMILNIERACQAAIDSAMHVIASQKLGIPKNSGDAFNLLHIAGILSKEITERLKAMTGFRNIAVHQYQEIEIEVLYHIAKEGWKDFVEFCAKLGLNIDGSVKSRISDGFVKSPRSRLANPEK
jgi:uncharacterized protein YutE (UPF0331/DUF86 family)